MKKTKKEILILSILIILFAIIITPKSFQNDTFFTIANGQRLLTYGFEEFDKLTWHENLEFTNDRYLFDIIITIIYNFSGFLGIYIFVIVIIAMIGLTYYYLLIKRKVNYVIGFFWTILIMYLGSGIIAARAQIISILLFIIEVYCIEKLLETNYKKYWISLIIIPIIIANTHASIFPVYFIFFLPYIAEAILYRFKFIQKDGYKIYIEKKENLKSLIIVMILGVLGGFITPIGEAPFTSMFKASNGISSEFISELQPLVPIQAIDFMLINILFIAIVAFTKTKINIADLFLFLGLDLMSLSTIRTVFYFTFLASIVLIKLIVDFLQEEHKYQYTIKPIIKKFFYVIISIVIILLSVENVTRNLGNRYIDVKKYPVDAVEYILQNLDVENMRIYNDFNYGSYLEFKGIKAFLDSRSGMFCQEFNDTTILEDYYKLLIGGVHYNKFFESYDFTHVLLYNTELTNIYIQHDSNWECIYQDDVFVLYEKVKD